MAKFYYGGQAVIEGVMMRGRRQVTLALRRRDGGVETYSEMLPPRFSAHGFARIPLLRGLVALWEMLVLGTRMLLYSASVQTRGTFDRDMPRTVVAGTIAFSLTFAIGLFFVVPLFVSRAGTHVFHGSLLINGIEGLVRLSLFIGYLALVGRMDRMRRVFEYHGAEHKTINAFEHGAELTPAAVQQCSTVHVRCGTAFILWVLVISIFVFALLGHPPILLGALARVILVPVIAALSYEILRLGARFYHIPVVRFVLQPGLWLQRLTTREPSDDQVEVAIAALQPVLKADGVAAERVLIAGARTQPGISQATP